MAISQIREPKTPSEELFNNVLSAIDERKDPSYRALSACELASGVIAVDDSLGETDIYFDLSMWDFTHPKLWLDGPNAGMFRNTETNVGVLPGIGRFPPVVGASMALEFARNHLTATVTAEWHMTPKQFETSN